MERFDTELTPRDHQVLATDAPLQTPHDFSEGNRESVQAPSATRLIKRGAFGFFKILYINLAFISLFILGTSFVVNGFIPFRVLIILSTPVDILIVLNKVISLKKDPEVKSKRQMIFGLLFSSQILDSMARCISCIIYFLVEYIDGFFYTLCLGPILITSLVIIVKNSCTPKRVDCI